ncbi:hypothetical protein HDU98_004877 [Podochytrium sp. JEL0797]|nr:hypothetical protein HDU98_004877 [Podochytrium sp. JEL0797]
MSLHTRTDQCPLCTAKTAALAKTANRDTLRKAAQVRRKREAAQERQLQLSAAVATAITRAKALTAANVAAAV